MSDVMACYIDRRIDISRDAISKLNDLKTTKRKEFDTIAKDKKNCLIATGVGAGVGLVSTGAVIILTGGLAGIPAILAVASVTTISASTFISLDASEKLKQLKIETKNSLILEIKSVISRLKLFADNEKDIQCLNNFQDELLALSEINPESHDTTIEIGAILATICKTGQSLLDSSVKTAAITPICLIVLSCMCIYKYKRFGDEFLNAENVIKNVIQWIEDYLFKISPSH
jgi:hypothetical protein